MPGLTTKARLQGKRSCREILRISLIWLALPACPGFFAPDTTLVIKLFSPLASEEIAFTVPHLRKNGLVRYFILLTDNHKYLTVKLSCLPALRFVIVCSPPFVYHFRRSLVLSLGLLVSLV